MGVGILLFFFFFFWGGGGSKDRVPTFSGFWFGTLASGALVISCACNPKAP